MTLPKLRGARGSCFVGCKQGVNHFVHLAFSYAAVSRLGVVVCFCGEHFDLLAASSSAWSDFAISIIETQRMSQGGRAVGFNTATLATSGMDP